jgi:hypothetical protein
MRDVIPGAPYQPFGRIRPTLCDMAPSTVTPETFARAVAGLQAGQPRPEITLEEAPAPQRLAPYAFALSGTVVRGDDEVATGRLILLHEPAGHEAWQGTMRLVTYVTAELEPELAADPLLPTVGWSWLVEALDASGAGYTAIGGTVTQTLSTRFGDLAETPTQADLEIRASWTPLDDDLTVHLDGWCNLLASTAGLPPPGVTALPEKRQSVSVSGS